LFPEQRLEIEPVVLFDETVFHQFNYQKTEKRVDHTTRSTFDEIRGVWFADDRKTLSRVFDVSSRSKQKLVLRSKTFESSLTKEWLPVKIRQILNFAGRKGSKRVERVENSISLIFLW